MSKLAKFKIITITVGSLIMAILLSVMLSKFLTIGLFPTSANGKIVVGDISIYVVSVDEKENKKDAELLSTEISKIGGAGYVYEEKGNFNILTSFYLSKSNAESVAQNLIEKYPKAKVKKIEIKKKVINIQMPEIKNNLKNLNKIFNDTINFFANFAIKLDKQETTASHVLLESLSVQAKIDEMNSCIQNSAEDSVVKIKILLKTIKNNLLLLSDGTTFNQFFKYMGLNIYMLINNSLSEI